MPHPWDVDYFSNQNAEAIATWQMYMISGVMALLLSQSGVPYIAVCVLCVCTLPCTNITTFLSLSPAPVGGGVLY